MHGAFVVHVRRSTCADIRASIRVSRFAIATCSPPPVPPFLLAAVQFPCPTNNPIYTPDYSGNRRGTERVAFNPLLSSSTWLLPLSEPSRKPSSYVPASTARLNRRGRFEGACPRRRFDRAASGSNMADRHVLSFVSRLDAGTVSRYSPPQRFIVLLVNAIFMTRSV